MRRFSGKELLLLAAPIALVGLAIWAPRLQERYQRSQAPFTYEVRQPTPLEISQGAQVAMTVRPSLPDSQQSGLMFKLHLIDPQAKIKDFQQKAERARVWESQVLNFAQNSSKLEANYAYNWTTLVPWNKPLTAKIELYSTRQKLPTFQQKLELKTDGLALPDRNSARRANFRITGVFLNYGVINGIPYPGQVIKINMKDASDERHGLVIGPQIIAKRLWQGDSASSIYKSSTRKNYYPSIESTSPPDISQVTIRAFGLRVPPPHGTKIQFLLSVNAGWPQEITLEAPEKLPQNGGAMKFTSKLTPLPYPSQNK